MSQTLSVSDAIMGKYTLSVTTRDCGDTQDMLEELTYRTIKAWLWIANQLEHGEYTLPLTEDGDMLGSVEQRLSNEFIDHDASMFPDSEGDARVTCWDTFKSQSRIGFHLNSSDIPQIAVNTWLANHKAIERVLAETPQNAIKTNVDAPPASATPPQGNNTPATTKASNFKPLPHEVKNWPKPKDESVTGIPLLLTKKQAIETLPPGSPFRMKTVQIEKHSKDGKDFYDFFEPYGGKAGQFSAKTIYADNEIAVNNGLIAYLETMGIQLGQALTGDWIVNATVGKPKTKTIKNEEKTFTDIYINSFEGQPETV